jgi:hypothetical protein
VAWKEFQSRLPTEEELQGAWRRNPTLNVGTALGPCGKIIRIDVDGPLGEQLLAEYSRGDLPATPEFRSGRANGGRGLIYAIPDGVTFKTTREQPESKEELRFMALGSETVLPPSRHPGGGLYTWLPRLAPWDVSVAPAPAWMVARWRAKAEDGRRQKGAGRGKKIKEGGRNSKLASLAGSMRRVGFDRESIEAALLAHNASHCDPPLGVDEVRAIAGSIASYQPGEDNHQDGQTRQMGDGDQGFKRYPIDLTDGDLHRETLEAWKAIHRSNEPPQLFRVGGIPSRIERDDEDGPIVRPATTDRMRHRLAEVALWAQRDEFGRLHLVHTPTDIVKNVLARPDPPLPILTRMVQCPVFGADGTLCDQPGYNAASRTFYVPDGLTVPRVAEAPSAAEVDEAKEMLLGEYLGDFPFVSDSERAHALAALILTFVRDLIGGPTPLHLLSAPCPGTGKSLLAELIAYPALGRMVGGMTEGDEDEWRKRLLAKLRTAPSVVFIDNVTKRLQAAALASALTSYPTWEDRLLGESEIICVPVRCTWVATANNPECSAELARRTIRVHLDSKTDQPWLRTGFKHADVRAWAAASRGWLIWAALILVRNWIAVGRPEGKKVLGMFESWAKVIGGILDAANVGGFLGNIDEFYLEADREGGHWRAFLAAWWAAHSTRPVTVADLVALAVGADVELGDKEHGRSCRLGRLIAKHKDRVFNVELSEELGKKLLRVTHGGATHRATVWRLREVQDG